MILYVLRYYPTLTETFAHDEIRRLREMGMSVELAAFGARGDPGADPPGFPVHAAPHRLGWLPWLPRLALELLRSPGRWLQPESRDRRVLWLAALLRQLGARAVHVHFAGEAAQWAQAACARVGLPSGLTLHATDLFRPHPALPAMLATARWRVSISLHNARWLLDRYGVQSVVIPCGVDPARLGVARTDGTGGTGGQGGQEGPPEFVAVGRNVPKKGFPLLLRALAGMQEDFRLHLISDHPPVNDPRVTVHGLLPRAAVYDRMRRARALILPCQRGPDGDMDGIPVVILEAMAMGVPVITTAISGIPEVVDGAVGWLLPPGEIAPLQEAIREALADPAGAARRGQAARARVLAGRTLEAQAAAVARLLRAGQGAPDPVADGEGIG